MDFLIDDLILLLIWRIPHQAEALQGGVGWDCQNTFPLLQGFMILS